MGRYLTPAKITLLVLALVYTEGSIPTSDTLTVVTFLVNRILLEPESSQDTLDYSDVSSIAGFERALSGLPSVMPGRTVWDFLLKKLWAIDCADALDAFVTNLPSLLAKTRDQLLKERDEGIPPEPAGKILRTSPLGAFIRRCHLEYTRLQFQDSVSIWLDFISYRMPTRSAYERRNRDKSSNALDLNLSDLNIDSSHPLAGIMFGRLLDDREQERSSLSTTDVERLMEFQISEMQKLGGRLPESMRTKLGQMSSAGASVPKLAHYLRFLDSWRAGDFSSAFDNLHRYFDYTMQSRDRTFYQYALLNLAILQADFGCHSEAIPAMQEAVAIARENRDTTCLNFCMSWLYHFGRAFPSQMQKIRESGILGSEVEGLAFLKSRAKDAEMWNLLSTSLLSEAKFGLQHGDGIATVFENIVRASHINTIKSLPQITGPTLLMKGSVFSRIGQTHMAWSCAERFQACHTREAPIEDILKTSCRMANLLSQMGRYQEAEAMMDAIPSHVLRVLKFYNYWMTCSSLLKIKRLLHRDELSNAEDLIHQLKGQGHSDIETEFSISLLEISYHMRRKNLSDALQLVEKLADRVPIENSDIMMQCKVMGLKARIWAESGSPLKGFSVIMRAVDIAYKARSLVSLWESLTILSNLLLEVHEFSATRDLLEAVLPQVLECQDCELTARTHSLLADAYMGLAGSQEPKSAARKENLNQVMEHIDLSLEQFKFIEDLKGQLEMLAKKAKIFHLRGDLVLANDTATQYLELRKEYKEVKT